MPVFGEKSNSKIQEIINAESADSQVKKLDTLFIKYFKSTRKKCESNLILFLEKRAKKNLEVKDASVAIKENANKLINICLLYTSPSPRDR